MQGLPPSITATKNGSAYWMFVNILRLIKKKTPLAGAKGVNY